MDNTKTTSIVPLSLFNSIAETLHISLSFFLGVYFMEIGFSGTQIGIIFAVTTIASIITVLPSGLSNDTIKSKHLIGLALILVTIQYFGISQTHNFLLITFLFLIGGTGNVLYKTSAESLFYKSRSRQNLSIKIGIFQGVTHLMIAAGMISSGYLLNTGFTFQKIFFVFAIAFFLMTITSQIILPTSETSKLEIFKYKKDIFRPKVLVFILILFLFAIHYGAEKTSYGLFLQETLHLDRFQMGLYMGISIIFMAVTAFILSKKFLKWKPKNILIFSLLVSGLGHILMTIKIPEISLIFRIVHEIGDASFFFFMYYGITKMFDLKRIGGNASIFMLTGTIGSTIGALISGPLGDHYGYNIPLVVTGITTLISVGITIKFIHLFDHK